MDDKQGVEREWDKIHTELHNHKIDDFFVKGVATKFLLVSRAFWEKLSTNKFYRYTDKKGRLLASSPLGCFEIIIKDGYCYEDFAFVNKDQQELKKDILEHKQQFPTYYSNENK